MEINELFKPLFTEKKRFKIFYGGRSAGKSWGFAQALLVLGTQEKHTILCTREIQKSITDSVFKLLTNIIDTEEYFKSFYDYTATEIKGQNGTQFFFKGLLRNIDSVKSIEGVTICWIEEAQSVSTNSYNILIPTIRKENSEIWITFNPQHNTQIVYKNFVKKKPNNAYIKYITYIDNPFNSKTIIQEAQFDKKNDIDKYNHVWLGELDTRPDEQIFKNWYVEDFKEVGDYFLFGLDFGFANDPTALIRLFIEDKNIYIDYAIGNIGIEIDDLAEMIRSVPKTDNCRIIADSSRPEMISHLRRRGLNVMGARKGANSIKDGIAFLKNYKIIVKPSCPNIIYELEKYSYKVNYLTNDIMPDILDKNNHWIDALRYAVERIHYKRTQRIIETV